MSPATRTSLAASFFNQTHCLRGIVILAQIRNQNVRTFARKG